MYAVIILVDTQDAQEATVFQARVEQELHERLSRQGPTWRLDGIGPHDVSHPPAGALGVRRNTGYYYCPACAKKGVKIRLRGEREDYFRCRYCTWMTDSKSYGVFDLQRLRALEQRNEGLICLSPEQREAFTATQDTQH